MSAYSVIVAAAFASPDVRTKDGVNWAPASALRTCGYVSGNRSHFANDANCHLIHLFVHFFFFFFFGLIHAHFPHVIKTYHPRTLSGPLFSPTTFLVITFLTCISPYSCIFYPVSLVLGMPV